ncbi:MAG: A24 family peptidase [Alphaproteobacteria bacterium]|nr:A24 family peptidase [Alphaproteobacteria bacterium]
MDELEPVSSLLDMFLGGVLALIAASLSAHFGYRAADRMPGESRRPHCLYCLMPLRLWDCLPILGWSLRHKARARPCACKKQQDFWRLPMIEISGFVLGIAAIWLAGDLDPFLITTCLTLGVLVSIVMIDLAFGVIPDELNITLALLGLIGLLVGDGDVYFGLINAAGLLGLGLLLALVYSKWRGQEMLGLGDVKFLAAAGLWLPFMQIPWFLLASGIAGIAMGVLWRFLTGEKTFPFAPALCLSLAGCLFYQLYLYGAP